MKRFINAAAVLFVVLCTSFSASARLTAEENGAITERVIFDGSEKTVFDDVSKSDWFYDDVMYICRSGVMSGTEERLFEPQTSLTRAMAITVIYRAAGSPTAQTASFSDVEADSWYAPAVAWGAENGIVSGTGDNEFSPYSDVTREQLALMLYNYGKISGKLNEKADISLYADYESVSGWAKEAMSAAVYSGIITGRSETELVPHGGASRAEAAAILGRFLKL